MNEIGIFPPPPGNPDGWESNPLNDPNDVSHEEKLGIEDDALVRVENDNSKDGSGNSSEDGSGDDSKKNSDPSIMQRLIGPDDTDGNGLQFPSLDSSMKDVLLVLGSKQSEIGLDRVEQTNYQIESFQEMKSTQFEKNIDKLSKMRKAEKNAQFWSKLAKDFGIAGAVATFAIGLATCNPVLMVAGFSMGLTIAMNELGATEAIMDALGPVGGTILLCSVIFLASAATGGVAGLTMFTTLTSGIVTTPENLENMGVSSDAAVWVALGIGIGCSLLCGYGMYRAASSSANAAINTSKAGTQAGAQSARTGANSSANASSSAARTSAKSGTQAASGKGASQVAGGIDDAARSASTASSASKATGAIDDASQAVDDAGDAARKASQHADDVSRGVSKSRMEKLFEGRLEKVMRNSFQKMSDKVLGAPIDSAEGLAHNVLRIGSYAQMSAGFLDLFTGAAGVVNTVYNYQASVHQADAELADAIYEYASDKAEAWSSMYNEISTSFNNNMDRTAEAINTYHSVVQGHLQHSI